MIDIIQSKSRQQVAKKCRWRRLIYYYYQVIFNAISLSTNQLKQAANHASKSARYSKVIL